jgi:hypothetical protein
MFLLALNKNSIPVILNKLKTWEDLRNWTYRGLYLSSHSSFPWLLIDLLIYFYWKIHDVNISNRR